jgi:hypothetical protein
MTPVSPTYLGTFVKCRLCIIQSPAAQPAKPVRKASLSDENVMKAFIDEMERELRDKNSPSDT